jgi:probable selenium-dependent hydroxylase accessory protein YqeC
MAEKGHIISIVGAGGKTSLMYHLADRYAAAGHKTLVSTTTHIYTVEGLAKTQSEVYNKWDNNLYAVVGDECGNNKLEMPKSLLSYIALADTTLLEADGARGLPCKIPRDKEPVIIPQSDIVVAVLGLDSIGKPLGEVCFNAVGAAKMLNVGLDHCLTVEDAAVILSSAHGLKKDVGAREYFIVLNKCDDATRENYGFQIAELLRGKGLVNVQMTCLL